MPTPTAEAITTAWKAESARLVGALTRMTRDVGLAEDLAQDALVSALESWPADGIPRNPGAWLMTAAKRRAIDQFRRADTLRRKTDELGHRISAEEHTMPDLDSQVDLLRALRSAGIGVDSTARWELRDHDHPAIAPLIARPLSASSASRVPRSPATGRRP